MCVFRPNTESLVHVHDHLAIIVPRALGVTIGTVISCCHLGDHRAGPRLQLNKPMALGKDDTRLRTLQGQGIYGIVNEVSEHTGFLCNGFEVKEEQVGID
jgi:hypothetical protein